MIIMTFPPQATSESSSSSTQLKRSLCKSMAALGAIAGFLEAAADEAVVLAEQVGAKVYDINPAM